MSEDWRQTLKTLNVLYAFKSETIERSITKEIMLRGYSVNGVMRTSKDLIKDYLKNHSEIDVVILKEYLDGGEVYSARELTELVDDVKNINVVIVLGTSHRGKAEMRDIYSAGILNAFFSDGKFGANPDKLAALACVGRTHREAREYYRINEVIPDHINLTYEGFLENYKYLIDNNRDVNIVNRFVKINQMLFPGQMGAFIDALPDNVKSVLMKYKEFYEIANKVYRLGYSRQKYKMPKDVKQGLSKEVIHQAMRDEKIRVNEQKQPNVSPIEDGESANMRTDIPVEQDIGVKKTVTKTKKARLKRNTAKNPSIEENSIFNLIGDVEIEGVQATRITEDTGWHDLGNDKQATAKETIIDIPDGGKKISNNGEEITDKEVDYSQLSAEELIALLGTN